jgi:zinc finger SWIM domain-containing protein 3
MDAEGFDSLEQINEYKSVAGQTFLTEEDCYDFYNEYALSKEFGIRKDRVRYKTGTKEVIWRRYMCSCEGYRSLKIFGRTAKKRKPVTSPDLVAWLGLMWSGVKVLAYGM